MGCYFQHRVHLFVGNPFKWRGVENGGTVEARHRVLSNQISDAASWRSGFSGDSGLKVIYLVVFTLCDDHLNVTTSHPSNNCPFPFSPLCFCLQVSLSGSMLDVYGGEQGMNAAKGGMSPTSNPSKLTVKREYTGMSF